MLKTLEAQLLKQATPPALKAEFAQYDFERLHGFCLLIYIASISIWLLFNLIVSFPGKQGFTLYSMAFLGALAINALLLGFTRQARHFQWLNLVFVLIIGAGIRLVIEGLPLALRPDWLLLGASSMLYGASVLPLRRWSFFATIALTWLLLDPFVMTGVSVLELRGVMLLVYALFLTALTLYSFIKLRQAKLHTYIMSKLLLEQAYNDTLTGIPNRRSFMAQANERLQAQPREHDHYLAMIDVDNFKKVNDRYGHDIGDEVLKQVAADIRTVMADFDYARLGGEEFAIYLAGVRRDDVERLAERLCQVVRQARTRYPVTVSIGLARVDDNDSLNQALVKADQALYQSKHTGKDRYTFHE
ncbi:diguanylate cyclase domain-containing protein [Pseudomonas sp. NPDC089530]|uniref:GGDEF domain-containing protein n=1 Tax=Pseudomonas sp. NPDC089530 TaxID=3390651 RepID=UPI003CFF4949